jgi:hypothetical protein
MSKKGRSVEGIMVELLQRGTKMQVFQVRERMHVEPTCVNVIPPNKKLCNLPGVLHLLNPITLDGLRLPIDFFFRMLAEDQRELIYVMVIFQNNMITFPAFFKGVHQKILDNILPSYFTGGVSSFFYPL